MITSCVVFLYFGFLTTFKADVVLPGISEDAISLMRMMPCKLVLSVYSQEDDQTQPGSRLTE